MSDTPEETIGKLRDQRFDGYSENMLADVIDLIRSGPGIGGIGAAVDALQSVATAFNETEHTLREQLGALGLSWTSDAARQAMTVFTDHAAFAEDANTKLLGAAEAGFALGEAFTRTSHRLPDPQTLRAGAGGMGVIDQLGSLVGYETDQAERVKAAQVARDQAVDALNAYAHDSGASLGELRPLADPAGIVLDGGQTGGEAVAFGSASDTVAASAGREDPFAGLAVRPPAAGTDAEFGCEPSTQDFAAGAPSTGSASTTQPSSGAVDSPASHPHTEPQQGQPSSGGGGVVGGGSSGSGGAPTARTGSEPPAPSPAPSAPAPAGSVGGAPEPGGTTGSGAEPSAASPAVPGSAAVPVTGAASGDSSGRVAGTLAVTGGPGAGATTGLKQGFLGGAGLGSGAPEQPLAKGKLTGMVAPPPASSGASGLGPGFSAATPRPAGGSDLAAGAAAVGAAGVAARGEDERERRPQGLGRGTEVDGRPLHEFPVGVSDPVAALEAETVEYLEPDTGPDEPAFLEQAAPQHGGQERVRSHGIDDVDLFADERMVARGTIDGSVEADRGGAGS